MKRAVVVVTIAAAALVTCEPAQGQLFKRGARVVCGPNGCWIQWQPLEPPPAAAAPRKIEAPRVELPAAPQCEVCNGESGRLDGEKNGVFQPIQASAANLEAWQLNGVHPEKVGGQKDEAYSCSGRWCTKIEALGAALDDDSGKLWLIVTGEGREKFVRDCQTTPALSDVLSRTRLWMQPADHFTVAGKGYPRGSPGIFFALGDGTELYSATSYVGPDDIEAIRKADPLYKPPAPPPGPTPAPGPPPTPGPLDPLNPFPPVRPPIPWQALLLLSLCGVIVWMLLKR